MVLRTGAAGLDACDSEQDVDGDAADRAGLVLVVEGWPLALAQYAVVGSLFSNLCSRRPMDDLGAKVPLRSPGSGMGAKLARASRDRRQNNMVLPWQTPLARPADFHLPPVDY